MERLFTPGNWPLGVVIVGMILAAVIDGWKRKVPNWLTFSLILTGWTLGLIHTIGLHPDGAVAENGEWFPGNGGIGASMGCTFVGFALLFPVLVINAMGQGDVKMQMGFGAWIGAFYGWSPGWWIVVLAFCIGGIVGGVLGLGMMVFNRSYGENLRNMRLILTDALATGSLSAMATRGKEIRSTGRKLPYGVPLCIGFVGFLFYLYLN
jgi:prepilin peptidase CpaA